MDSDPAFVKQLEHLARRLFFSAPRVTERNRDFLQEFAAGRHQLVALQRLIMCARASNDPADREALAEIIRAECLKDLPRHGAVAAAFDEETVATGAADLDQRHFERTPCRSTYQRVRESLTRQLNATRASLDAIAQIRL